MKKEEIFNKAIKTYGDLHQISKASEECSELSANIQKYLQSHLIISTIKSHENDLEKIKIRTLIEEEIADVEMTIEQLKIILKAKKAVERFKKVKLARLKEDLNKIHSQPVTTSDAIIDQDASITPKLLS